MVEEEECAAKTVPRHYREDIYWPKRILSERARNS